MSCLADDLKTDYACICSITDATLYDTKFGDNFIGNSNPYHVEFYKVQWDTTTALKPQLAFLDFKREIGQYQECLPKYLDYIFKFDSLEPSKKPADFEYISDLLQASDQIEPIVKFFIFTLLKIKTNWEKENGLKATEIVLTVPAYFNSFQVLLYKDAALLAGFRRVLILNEPTAAIISYLHHATPSECEIIGVIHLEMYSLDLSVLEVSSRDIQVKLAEGHPGFGYGFVEKKLYDFITSEYEKIKRTDGIYWGKELFNLKQQCQEAVAKLSHKSGFVITFKQVEKKISHEMIQVLKDDYKTRTEDILRRFLYKSQFKGRRIYLSGDTAYFPELKQLQALKNFHIIDAVDPKLAVLGGAAIFAHSKNIYETFWPRQTDCKLENALKQNLLFFRANRNIGLKIPLKISKTLGLKGNYLKIASRNQVFLKGKNNIAEQANELYMNLGDDLNTCGVSVSGLISVSVYAGENNLVEDNILLGEIDFEFKENSWVNVRAGVDTNSRLNVFASQEHSRDYKVLQVEGTDLVTPLYIHSLRSLDDWKRLKPPACIKTKISAEHFGRPTPILPSNPFIPQKSLEGPIVGMDLGTTFCCLAVKMGEEVECISFFQGHQTTPSVVTVKDGTFLAGELALGCAHINPENNIFHIKRMIGRSFEDDIIKSFKRMWPFEIRPEENKLQIQINDKMYYPEDVLTELALHLKSTAKEYLAMDVTHAVVAVPYHFSKLQVRLTKEAVTKAGWNVVRIIHEPTAAALAYNANLKHSTLRNFLIFDLGGGTFDVAVVESMHNHVKILAVDGDPCLGGEDFDNEMVDHCIEEFKKQFNINLGRVKNTSSIVHRIRIECEKLKRYFIKLDSITVSIDSIYNCRSLVVEISKSMFFSWISNHLKTCMTIVDRVLVKAGCSHIDEIILVGGSTRIPKVSELLREKFHGVQIKHFKPDEAVARGAAIFGHLIQNNDSPKMLIQEIDKLIATR